jgi:hypothetical protein
MKTISPGDSSNGPSSDQSASGDASNKIRGLWPLIALLVVVVIAGVNLIHYATTTSRYAMGLLTASIGHELIATTNSTRLVEFDPELRATLAVLLASPTRLRVRYGDEPPPLGDGRASSRLFLTNEIGQAVILRLQADRHTSGMFRVLSYWQSPPHSATNASQPLRLETNGTPPGER